MSTNATTVIVAKKPRSMTCKWFLSKCNTKAAHSAAAFLSQYRSFLETGELAEKTSPILAKLDAGKILPTPCLQAVQFAVLAHIVEVDRKTLEANQAKVQTSVGTSVPKNWTATIYNAKGIIQSRTKENGEVEELVKEFDLSQSADRWADRHLFNGGEGWYAVIDHATLVNVSSRIERADAIARVLKQKKGPTVQVKGKSTKTLGFGVRCKEDRCSFSRG